MSRLPAGTDIILLQADGETPGWKVRAGGGGSGNDIFLIRFDSDGVEQDEPVVIDWATGDVTLSADIALGDDITVDNITANTATVDSRAIHNVLEGTEAIAALGIGSVVSGGSSVARDLVIGSTSGSSHGFTILTGNSGTARMHFGDAADNDSGRISYNHSSNQLDFVVNGTAVASLNGTALRRSTGSLSLGTDATRWVNTFTQGFTPGYRAVAQDGALTLATTDYTIHLDSTTGTKAATMTTTGMGTGQRMRVLLDVATGGAYTLAANRAGASGTVTLNASGEGVDLVFDGTSWIAEALLGGATFA